MHLAGYGCLANSRGISIANIELSSVAENMNIAIVGQTGNIVIFISIYDCAILIPCARQ
jgi:hypothetical protein